MHSFLRTIAAFAPIGSSRLRRSFARDPNRNGDSGARWPANTWERRLACVTAPPAGDTYRSKSSPVVIRRMQKRPATNACAAGTMLLVIQRMRIVVQFRSSSCLAIRQSFSWRIQVGRSVHEQGRGKTSHECALANTAQWQPDHNSENQADHRQHVGIIPGNQRKSKNAEGDGNSSNVLEQAG